MRAWLVAKRVGFKHETDPSAADKRDARSFHAGAVHISENGQILVYLVICDVRVESIELEHFVLDEVVDQLCPERLPHELAFPQVDQGLAELENEKSQWIKVHSALTLLWSASTRS